MNTTQTVRCIKLGVGVLAASSVTLFAASAQAASFNFTSSTADASIASGGGPTFIINNAYTAAGATISFTASGTVNLDSSGAKYNTNAAGIVTTAASTIGGAGSSFGFGTPPVNYGALLLGNSTLGFKQVFPTTPANGAGGSIPIPTNLTYSGVSLSSLFSGGLALGDVLTFKVADDNYSDNTGSFTVSGNIIEGAPTASPTDVPEPFTIVGTLIGGSAAVRMRNKLKAKV